MNRRRFVFDTTTLVSAALIRGSMPDRALQHALKWGDVLLSAETLHELAGVLRRPKFDRYVSVAVREEFLEAFVERAVWAEVTEEVHACRDPKDDKFLALAVTGDATAIVSGDRDLLVLHPFRGIAVREPAAFVTIYETAR